MRVLLAIDEFSASNEALQVMKERTWPADTTVRVLHVIEKYVPPVQALWYDGGGDPESVQKEVAGNAETLVTTAAQDLKNTGLVIETAVRFGGAAKTIVKEAKEWDANLIVIGSHCYTGLKRLSGGVARFILSHAPCSVEVAHSKRFQR